MGKQPKIKVKIDIPTLQNIENLQALELLKQAPLHKTHTHNYTFLLCYFVLIMMYHLKVF